MLAPVSDTAAVNRPSCSLCVEAVVQEGVGFVDIFCR